MVPLLVRLDLLLQECTDNNVVVAVVKFVLEAETVAAGLGSLRKQGGKAGARLTLVLGQEEGDLAGTRSKAQAQTHLKQGNVSVEVIVLAKGEDAVVVVVVLKAEDGLVGDVLAAECNLREDDLEEGSTLESVSEAQSMASGKSRGVSVPGRQRRETACRSA